MRLRMGRLSFAVAVALGLSGCGDSTKVTSDQEVSVPGPGTADYTADGAVLPPSNTYVTLSGVVSEAGPNGFTMLHGGESIQVEMDDWDSLPEGSLIKQGDGVVVRGLVDRGFWERRMIEASSVYVAALNAYIYASATDEEDFALTGGASDRTGSGDEALGYVTAIEGRELTIGTGDNAVRVDTSQMRNNPLDDEGSPRVRVGDRVFAYGTIEIDPTEQTELMASGVVRLMRPGGPARIAPSPSPVATGTASGTVAPTAAGETASPSPSPRSPPGS